MKYEDMLDMQREVVWDRPLRKGDMPPCPDPGQLPLTPEDRMPVLTEREATHGNFVSSAATSQAIKGACQAAEKWLWLSVAQREALDQIANKLGRLLNGDPNEPDHWLDIAGYANLGREACRKKAGG